MEFTARPHTTLVVSRTGISNRKQTNTLLCIIHVHAGPWQFDLGELLEDIKQVTKWFELGLRLGTDHAELTKIERNRKLEGIELCKADMIDFWRKNSGNVTLRKFLSALEEIGHRNLAKQLQEKYNAGAPQIGICISVSV